MDSIEQPAAAAPIDVAALRVAVGALADVGIQAEAEHARQRAHGSGWYRFWQWCDERGAAEESLPVATPVLAEWCAWAFEHLEDAQIATTLASIKARHLEAGFGEHLAALGSA